MRPLDVIIIYIMRTLVNVNMANILIDESTPNQIEFETTTSELAENIKKAHIFCDNRFTNLLFFASNIRIIPNMISAVFRYQ